MSTGSSEPEPTGGAERRRRRSLRGEVGTTGARFGSSTLRRSLDDQPTGQPAPARRRRSLRGEVGATGARFGSAALRRSLEERDEHPEHLERAEDPERDGSGEPVGGSGEREAGSWAGGAPFPESDADTRPMVPAGREPEPGPEPEPVVEEFSGPLVRPYAWTGGRTSAAYDLRLETLVSLEGGGIAIALRESTSEQRSIVELCATGPRSVAEVSALLSVPLGVARVLVGDLIGMGVVAAHDNAAAPGGADLVLLERVLAGLRNL
ncbi:DUF742 domain-containing protein [Saccharothrix xinjiangensis]|uniref:DUF742 domain-containing protein n=1 Tax=Saccharothrix xinjiangensis TaxID=204798 RepID=A0ABV9YCJ5_9PSEU